MDCPEVRRLADSFVSGELSADTSRDVLGHLEGCADCRADIEGRRRLRASLRSAFERADELRADPALASRVRDRLRAAALEERARRVPAWRSWAIAAAVVIAVGLAAFWTRQRFATAGELARAAVGDHRNCALRFQLAEKPIPLDQAAREYDAAYRTVENIPPRDVPTSVGPARVLERHSCVYAGRRFAHVVLEFRGVRVSLLVTAADASEAGRLSRPVRVDDMSLVSVQSGRHAILLVGDLDQAALASLADAIVPPLSRELAGV